MVMDRNRRRTGMSVQVMDRVIVFYWLTSKECFLLRLDAHSKEAIYVSVPRYAMLLLTQRTVRAIYAA